MKNRVCTLTVLAFVVLLSACSSSKNAASLPAPQAAVSMDRTDIVYDLKAESEQMYEAGVASNSASAESTAIRGDSYYTGDQSTLINTEKIIMNGDIALETDEFDSTIAYIRGMISYYEGYTASSNLYTTTVRGELKKRYTAVIKVPAERFGNAFDNLKNLEGLTNASQRQENVSDRYYDTESRLSTRKVEEERLLSLIAKATEINDILGLERRLSQVRTDIELYESQLKNIDRLVAYSTINVNVYEVSKISFKASDSFMGRIIDGFFSSIDFMLWIAQNFTYIIAVATIPLVILLAAVVIIVSIIRRIIRKG